MASLLSLSSLLGQSTITDHDQVLEAANAALNKSGKDIEAQHVKVVALLKLDRFDEALKTLDHGGDQLKEKARLEWAYALYKAGQPDRAAEVAKSAAGGDVSDRGMRHVEAQASYRIENFERAAQLFTQLAAGGRGVAHEDMDLRINNSAVNAQLEWAGKGDLVESKKPEREDLEAFETAYNAACGSIARGELGQAEVLLRRSKDLCNALDDLSEEEKQAEILPIIVQQIYVLIRQGRLEDASNLASTINVSDVTESSTQHIAQTNTTAASSEPANPYLTHRIIHKAPSSIKPDKPFTYQSAAMTRNNYALDLLSQKYPGIIASTTLAVSKKPSPTLDANLNSLSAFNAAAHARNQAGKDALKAVLPVLEKRPTDIGLLLVVIQLYVLSANHGAAISLLESFFARLTQESKPEDLDVRYSPGLVATMTSLYSARHQSGHARTELANAAKYWRKRTASSSNTASPLPERAITHLYKSAATALLASHDQADAALSAELFAELNTHDSQDRYALAGLVAANASANQAAVTDAHLASLTPVGRLLTGIDVDALESAGVVKPTAPAAPSAKRAATDAAPAPKKSKKLRKTKTPKDFVPGKTMDAERWLPMKDRTYYRPKGKDKKKMKERAMLTQGGPVTDEISRPGTPAAEVLKAQGGAGGKKGGAKKKGKGGKW